MFIAPRRHAEAEHAMMPTYPCADRPPLSAAMPIKSHAIVMSVTVLRYRRRDAAVSA